MRSAMGVLIAPALSLLAASAILLTDQQTGILPLARADDEVSSVRAELQELEQERQWLGRRIRQLRTVDLAIETAAREQLGMLRPGELVVRWSDGAAPAD